MRRKKVRKQHNPPAIQRDRGATPDPESLPNFATSYFLRIFNALKIHLLGKKTFALQLPLEQAVTHSGPSFAIFRLRFAVCVLTSVSFVRETCLRWNFFFAWDLQRGGRRLGSTPGIRTVACTDQYIGLTSSFLAI